MKVLIPNGTDDLAQLQTACDQGGWIILTKGTFNLSAPVKITNPVKISGEGIGSTFIEVPYLEMTFSGSGTV